MLNDGNSLLSLPEFQAFKRAWLLAHWQETREERDNLVLEHFRSTPYSVGGELLPEELVKNDWCAMYYYALPQTITTEEDLLTPPAGLTPFARDFWIAAQQKKLSELMPLAHSEYQRLVDFLTRLCKLCIALSVPEQRIIVPSNQYQPRKEQKITYVMHPEKVQNIAARTLTHPRRTVADLVAEKERDLLDLAPYTAAYKLLSTGGGAPVKGVLLTFDLQDEHPYYIAYGLRNSIIAVSHGSKYSMLREDIETEIKEQRRGQEKKDREEIEKEIQQQRRGKEKREDGEIPSRYG